MEFAPSNDEHAGSPSTKPAEVLLYVEQDAPSRFKIQSDQLEHIGAKLRGRRRFSVFNSLVLPALVTLLTTILTGTFQYLSWMNTVRLQAATATAERADATFDKVATLIGQRAYAIHVFIPSVRDLADLGFWEHGPQVQHPPAIVQSEPRFAPASTGTLTTIDPTTTGAFSAQDPLASIKTPFENKLSELVGERTNHPSAGALMKTNAALLASRFDNYYLHLARWNEQYDQLLADVDHDLDRPIQSDANISSTALTVFNDQIKTINCRNNLTQELKRLKLDDHSMKLMLAAIHFCFGQINGGLDAGLTKLLHRAANRLEPTDLKNASDQLGHLRTMANEFRCIGLQRGAYYKSQKEKSIFIPNILRTWVFNPTPDEARKHFSDTSDACGPKKRPT